MKGRGGRERRRGEVRRDEVGKGMELWKVGGERRGERFEGDE